MGPTTMPGLMSPNKGETAVLGWRCPVAVAVHMREVLAMPWLGICVPLLKFVSTLRRSYRAARVTNLRLFFLFPNFPGTSEGQLTGGFLPSGFH